MRHEYIINKKSFVEIAKTYDVSNVTVKNYCKKFNIPIRSHKENQQIQARKNVTIPLKKELQDLASRYPFSKIRSILKISYDRLNELYEEYNIDKKEWKNHSFIPPKNVLYEMHHKNKMSKREMAIQFKVRPSKIDQWFSYHKLNFLTRKTLMRDKLAIDIPEKEELEELYNKKHYTTYKIASLYNVSDVTIGKWLKYYDISCRTIGRISQPEQDLQDWLNNDLKCDFHSTRSILSDNREIDLYDDNLKIGIEYCGLYWHNEDKKPSYYHYDKWKECQEKQIRLITIFEDEWLTRETQVKNYLKSVLNKNKVKLYARQCDIAEISKSDFQSFVDQYHIQGKTNNKETCIFALTYEKEIVAVISASYHHRNNKDLVLNRLCFKDNHYIIGGSKRLFAHLRSAYPNKDIISWSDNRWSDGKIYNHLGFVKDQELSYDYSYVLYDKRYSKQGLTKTKLKCSANETEHQKAYSLGYRRIYDCGKIRWRHSPFSL